MKQISELEALMQAQIGEHKKLLGFIESQQAAMKVFDLAAMENAARLAEAARLRIAVLENRRRACAGQLARLLRIDGKVTIPRIAEMHPPRAAALLALRDELKALVTAIQSRTFIAGKLAGAVVGHLNTVVRLLAGAVEKAGLYTKHGIPQVSARIGVMEAVG